MLEITLLGTGDVAEIPVYGCQCEICLAAKRDQTRARKPCSAMIRYRDKVILIDAGLTDLHQRFERDEITAILQTHYHADHAQGMLPLRWGIGRKIPVLGPDDKEGFADLYKNPGLLSFQAPWQHGITKSLESIIGVKERDYEAQNLESLKNEVNQKIDFEIDAKNSVPETEQVQRDILITALNLNHSKPTIGYCIDTGKERFAYLTDTVGLPAETLLWLQQKPLDYLIIDCSEPPQESPPRNHNDINLVLEIASLIDCRQVVLTHIGHALEAWLTQPENRMGLPENFTISFDNMQFLLR